MLVSFFFSNLKCYQYLDESWVSFSRPLVGVWRWEAGLQVAWLHPLARTRCTRGNFPKVTVAEREGVALRRSTFVTEKGGRQVGNSKRPKGSGDLVSTTSSRKQHHSLLKLGMMLAGPLVQREVNENNITLGKVRTSALPTSVWSDSKDLYYYFFL